MKRFQHRVSAAGADGKLRDLVGVFHDAVLPAGAEKIFGGRASIDWNHRDFVCSSMIFICATASCFVGYMRRLTGGVIKPRRSRTVKS